MPRLFASGIRERLPRWTGIAFLLFLGVLTLAAQENRTPSSSSSEAENDYLVSFWRTAQGLPHNTVNALLQTKDGYLWVGTGSGLARFDGLVFTPIGPETGLGDVVVTALLEDQRGGLWVGTQGKGVFRLLTSTVQRYTGTEGLAGDAVTSLAEDSTGKVWIGTQNGLNYWVNGRLFRFQTSATRKDDSIVALHAGEAGALWVTTRSGVFRLQNGQAAPFRAEHLPQGRNAEFIGAYEDRAGNLWAFGATFLLNVTQGRSLNSFPSFSLTSSRVWTICEQGNGDFWIGTSGQGLFRFQNGRFEAVGGREGLEQCDIRALHADRWGNLWIGTGGNGLARLRTRRLRSVGQNEGLNSQRITSIASDLAGGLWVGTADTGLWHWNGTRAEQWSGGGLLAGAAEISSLCVDARTNLWAGTIGQGVVMLSGNRQRRFGTSDGLQDDQIRCVAAARDGEAIWVGTQAGTIHLLRGNTVQTCDGSAMAIGLGAITTLLPEHGETLLAGTENGLLLYWDGKSLARMAAPSALVGRPINCLFEDRRGRLWVCSGGAGAFCRQGDTWIPLTRKQGLSSDYVQMVTQADSGLFWLATEENLYKTKSAVVEAYLSGTRESISFAPALVGSELDGFKCARGWPSVAHGQKALWVACTTELLPLGQIENPGAEPAPPVILERVLINGQPVVLPENGVLQLGPGVRSVDFEFSAISFNAPQKVRFRHQLENFDPEWVQTDAGRRAHYGPLPAGHYKFRVIAANAEGVWNETGASLGIEVIPPIWKSWWFLVLVGITTFAGIWAAARFISTRRLERRLRAAEQRHAMERERARIAQDMHDEIGSKLTRISFLSEIARGSAGGGPPVPPIEAIASTSRELLQALDEIVWAVNPRNDNLEQLAGYLEQHAREYFQGTACDFQIEMPLQFPVVSLSAELRHNVFLAFEEALNNCLKHARATKVSVAMRVHDDNDFEVRVQDEGRGFDPASNTAPEQDGLSNMRDRLRSVGGTCEIESRPGAGTTVTFRFPLAGEHNRHVHK